MEYLHDDTPKRWKRLMANPPPVKCTKTKKLPKPISPELVLPGEKFMDYDKRLKNEKKRIENEKKLQEIDESVRKETRKIRPKRREFLIKRKKLLKDRSNKKKEL